jgi:hypothetical protein
LKHKTHRSTLAAFALAVLTCAPALGDVLYTQPASTTSGAVLKSSYYNPDGSDIDEYVWDSFVLPQAGNLTEIRWRGAVPGGGTGGCNIAAYVIGIYASIPAGTQPDLGYQYPGPLRRWEIINNCAETYVGAVGGTSVYEYHFTLPQSFALAGGTKYWVQIEAWQNAYPPTWGLATASGGNGSHFHAVGGTGLRFYNLGGDAAFTLSGTWVNCSVPSITLHPTPVTGCYSGAHDAQFTVAASGTGPFTYRWKLNGSPVYDGPNGGGHGGGAIISGATTPTLTIQNASYWADTGTYTCEVSNACGPTTSNGALLAVPFGPPSITQNPAPASVCRTGSATFSAAATGTFLSYGWQVRHNGSWIDLTDGPLLGDDQAVLAQVSGSATTSVRVDLAPPFAARGTDYRDWRCVVTNGCASVPSALAPLGICVADFNCDSTVDFFDYLDFVAAFDSEAQTADFNADGSIDFFDYLDFALAFDAGC